MAIGYTAGGQDVYTPNVSDSGGGGTSGGVTMTEVLEKLYPVGSVILRYDEEDPNEYLGVGTWEQIPVGRFFVTSTSGSISNGTGVTLSEENLPVHTHNITVDDAGSHTHTATVSEAGEHTHTATSASAGAHTHDITVEEAGEHTHTTATSYNNNQTAAGTDYTRVVANGSESASNVVSIGSAGEHTHTASSASAGAHTHSITNENAGEHTHTVTNASAGSHTHTATASETGEGSVFNITHSMVSSLYVSAWRRTA